MKQWSFYCKRKLCHGIGASEQQGGGQGDASRNTWFRCVLQLLIRTLQQKHSHARRPPLVTASQIALSPMVLLLASTSRLFSRPLLILLCCLISKDFPYPGSESQLDVTLLVCMHPHHFPIGSPFFPLQVRRQKNRKHFYMIKDLCRASSNSAKWNSAGRDGKRLRELVTAREISVP